MKYQSSESAVRWQQLTISQLSYAINLILILSTGSIGFSVNLLNWEKFSLSCSSKPFFDIGGAILFLSTGFSIWATINRLRDFRLTAKIARDRDKGVSEEEINKLRSESDKLGACTWKLFRWQISLFFIGFLLIAISVVIVFHDKLI